MAISNALRDPYDENNPTKSIAKPKPLVQTAAVTGAPGLPSPSPATVKPTVPAIARPGASLGTSAGRGFRALTNAGIGATETAANAISYPTRVAGGFLRDAQDQIRRLGRDQAAIGAAGKIFPGRGRRHRVAKASRERLGIHTPVVERAAIEIGLAEP